MTIGPLEFVVIGCKGNQFTSEIVPELNSIQEKGLIRVVDLFFVRKDINGTVTVLEVNDLNDEELAAFDPIKEDLMGLLTPEDIVLLTEAIPPDTSAVIVLLEHSWIVKLADGINRAGAVLLAGGMVPQASMEQLEAELKADSATKPGELKLFIQVRRSAKENYDVQKRTILGWTIHAKTWLSIIPNGGLWDGWGWFDR